MIKKILVLILVAAVTVTFTTSCQRSSTTVKVVKPKKHWFPYKHSRDKRKKRTKIVRMKS